MPSLPISPGAQQMSPSSQVFTTLPMQWHPSAPHGQVYSQVPVDEQQASPASQIPSGQEQPWAVQLDDPDADAVAVGVMSSAEVD